MLRRSVSVRALGAFLGCAPVTETLCRHLGGVHWPEESGAKLQQLPLKPMIKELQEAIQNDIDQRTGGHHRPNEPQMLAQRLCDPDLFKEGDIPALDAAFDAVMERKGSRVFFRDEHALDYAELLAEIDPTVVVAWQFAKDDIPATASSLADFKATVESVDTLFVGPRFFDQPFAENHAHLGGIAGDDLVLAHVVLVGAHPGKEENAPTKKSERASSNSTADEEEKSPEYPQLKRLRRIHGLRDAFIAIWKSGDVHGSSTLEDQERRLVQVCKEDTISVFAGPVLDWQVQDDSLAITSVIGGPRWIFKQLAGTARDCDFQHAWMWLFVLLWQTFRATTASATIRAAVLLLVADIMVLRRQLIMDGSGLRRFATNYFAPVLRNIVRRDSVWQKTSYTEAARRVFAAAGDRAELKIAAKDFRETDITKVFAKIAHARIGSLPVVPGAGGGTPPRLSALDHWHFCLHLTRVGNEAPYARRKKLWDEARALKDVLGSQAKWDISPLTSGGGPSTSQFAPAHFVRGLDVAGDETAWPIAIFAPMLRWIRHEEIVNNPMGEATVPAVTLHLSIHAGEDYAHPLSGLRHVDETVLFCQMRKGDRLGHGLALGISPDEWFDRHGEALLPVDDHVDNLVWAWHQAGVLIRDKQLPEAQRVLKRLEQRIDRFIPYVSWLPRTVEPSKPSLQALYEAWSLRRNCCYQVLNQPQNMLIGDSKSTIGAPDLHVIEGQIDKPDIGVGAGLYVLWARYERDAIARAREKKVMIRSTHYSKGKASRSQLRLEMLGPDQNLTMHDHENEDDLKFMRALQDACIERYAQDELSIEVNPSSNVYIGQLETYRQHPIYRWYPPDQAELNLGGKSNQFGLRTIPMPVTINTDDQGIVPTTLRMEHHLMHEVALDHGYAESVANAWIEKLRALGEHHFSSTHHQPQNGA